jgi:hypothetical protein
MSALITAVEVFLAAACHGRELPLDETQFAEDDPMRSYLRALNRLYAALLAAQKAAEAK